LRSKFFNKFAAGFVLLLALFAAGLSMPLDPAAKLFPERLGDFRAASPAVTPKAELIMEATSGVTSIASRAYVSKDGQKFWLTLMTAPSNSGAYALLTNAKLSSEKAARVNVGTAGFQLGERLLFVKGTSLVVVTLDDASRKGQTSLEIARAFADTLDKGEGDIPVLIKHLPNWESVLDNVSYAVDKDGLKRALGNQPVLDALSFHGGAEAAVADYNGLRMVLVEFNTPQIATDNDQRVSAKLEELRNQGQAQPTAYRRVGNYAVFVFDAPNQEAANQLIDQVKYQQMVQWLGENPYRYDEAVREFTETTLGVFVSVVKASGLVIIGSLAIGGLLGALLFTRRRAQQRAQDAYSDAGGMLRLNLDEITPPTNSARLLGPGN
jgi:uncharacterized protein DUF6599